MGNSDRVTYPFAHTPQRIYSLTAKESMMTNEPQSTFGYKWENFPIVGDKRPALADPKSRIERNRWNVDEFTTWIDGKNVLDAGCGMGWWTAYLSNINPNKTVGVNLEKTPYRRGHELGNRPLVVGDIGNLPFPDETFDYISCEEVIHHTPDPPQYLQRLVDKLASGGTLTVYMYKKNHFSGSMQIPNSAIRRYRWILKIVWSSVRK